jgi:disulfide bond formation protein DsbB
MTELVANLNYLLALGTLLLQVVSVFLLVVYLREKDVPGGADVARLVREWGLHIALLVTAVGTALTLYYSEVLGFPPCSLCWFQRIFLYPQVVLFAIAVWRKDSSVALYAMWLSVLGLVPALYQHVMQVWELGILPCPAGSTEGANCAQRLLFEFGYITYPLMAATLFAFIIILMLFVRRAKRAEASVM